MSDPTPPEGQPVPPQQPTYPAQPPAYPTPSAPPAYEQGAYGQPYAQPNYAQQQYGAWSPPTPGPDKRPGTVTAAAVITWISCALSLGFAALMFVFAAVMDQAFFDDIERELEKDGTDVDMSDLDVNDLRTGLIVIGIILLVWSLSAIVAAVFAYRRSNGGRITLVVSASVAIIPLALGTITVLLPGLFLIAAITTIVLLFTGGANEWYKSKNQLAPVQPGTPPGGPTYY
ncbi:DUF4064 domain-containing protein [Nocardioides marmoriginsengisoli]|uniref:DUF4064 domain-containing protein n=1 Tax=Nocardioides marmoriginsengisoli TaxID=661483 RepID=A0A3N0CB60_9ACTN|nr:DUF4064 domain-containing protein [Nocardioides marmoriginsengisoli]RNL60481.1 DUF4064 domain-containing protein [Nocardioides marmoriginsengisoli]